MKQRKNRVIQAGQKCQNKMGGQVLILNGVTQFLANPEVKPIVWPKF